MKSYIGFVVCMLMASMAGVANAQLPNEVAPQLGFYLTKSFGSQQSVPAEYGVKFHYGDARSNIYLTRHTNYRPALLDIKFNHQGLTAFKTAGVNVLEPQYMLGAGEEGFFSSINWGMVGLAAFAAGIYYAAEQDRDDREDRIAEQKRKAAKKAAEEEGGGEEPAPEGGSEGTLCDPSGTLGCSPVDPTADGGGGEPAPEGGSEGTLCDPSGNLGCSPVDPTADGGGGEPAPDGGGTTGTPLDAAVDPVADATGAGGEPAPDGGSEPVLGCDPALGSGQCL